MVTFKTSFMSLRGVAGEFFAEFVGTFVLVFSGNNAVAESILTEGMGGNSVTIYFGYGFGLFLGLLLAGNISGGHLNPAVTVAEAVFKRIKWHKVFHYILAQYLGAFFAACATYLVYIDTFESFHDANGINQTTASIFATYPKSDLSITGSFIDQILGSMILVLAIHAVTDPFNKIPGYLAPIYISLTLVSIACSLGINQGFALNPARDFSPRFFTFISLWGSEVFGYGSYWYVAVLGPHIGAILGASIYVFGIYNLRPIQEVVQVATIQAPPSKNKLCLTRSYGRCRSFEHQCKLVKKALFPVLESARGIVTPTSTVPEVHTSDSSCTDKWYSPVMSLKFYLFLVTCFVIVGAASADIFGDFFKWDLMSAFTGGEDEEEEALKREEEDSSLPSTCDCKGMKCDCCVDFNISTLIDLGGPGCVNMKYISKQEGVLLNVSYGESVLHSQTVTNTNKKGTCMSLLSYFAEICARFVDLKETENGMTGCLNFEPMVLGEVTSQYHVGCFRMGPDGMFVVNNPDNSTASEKEEEVTTQKPEEEDQSFMEAVNQSAQESLEFFSNLLGFNIGKKKNNKNATQETEAATQSSRQINNESTENLKKFSLIS